MNQKSVKVDIDFNEALRRIANTPKDSVIHNDEHGETIGVNNSKDNDKKKTAPSKKKDAA